MFCINVEVVNSQLWFVIGSNIKIYLILYLIKVSAYGTCRKYYWTAYSLYLSRFYFYLFLFFYGLQILF